MNDAATPSDIRDPKAVQNTAGAVAMYRGAIDAFIYYVSGGANSLLDSASSPKSIPSTYVVLSGILTDELSTFPHSATGSPSAGFGYLDLRSFDGPSGASLPDFGYLGLHLVRGRSRIARAQLRQYSTDYPPEWLSHLYAIEAFAAVLLAEFRCSGIPLGTLDADGGFTVTRGFTTDEVYTYALAHFDSALATAGDSVRFRYLAQLGKARALLGLGDMQGAADAVVGVPDAYRYVFTYTTQYPKFIPDPAIVIQSDYEGVNGLPFISSGDPRTALPELMNRTAPFVFATGVEVRLLQAEAAVRAGNANWLSALNALRTTCVLNGPCPSLVPAGFGGIAGLPPLSDPAAGMLTHEDSVNARIDLVFSERAFWLYLTGRRQGDLRRLVRHYGRLESQVYPIGLWGTRGTDLYGTSVVVPTPDSERQRNSLYRGCDHLDA